MKKVYKLKESLRQVILTRYGESGVEAVESFFNERASFILGSDTRYFRFFLNNRSLQETLKDEIHFTPEDFEVVCVFDPDGWNLWPAIPLPKLKDDEVFVYQNERYSPIIRVCSYDYLAQHTTEDSSPFLFKVIKVDLCKAWEEWDKAGNKEKES